MTLRKREYLNEMAAIPSLVQLQRKGNKKPATKKELQNARKRALRLKTPSAVRAAAKDAWEMMEKRQVIQVFLDREAELLNPKRPVPKPLFMDKRVIKWASIDQHERKAAAKWLGAMKTEAQLQTLLDQAKKADKKKSTKDSKAKIKVYQEAQVEWKRNHRMWRDSANKTRLYFG